MLVSISFAVCGLIYMLIIAFIILWKKQIKNKKNLAPIIYKFLIYYTIFICIFEIIFIICTNNIIYNPALAEFLGRARIFFDIVWVSLLFTYIWCSIKKEVDLKTRYKQRRNVSMGLSFMVVVVFIYSCTLDIRLFANGNNHIITACGPARDVVFYILIGLAVILVFAASKGAKTIQKSNSLIIVYFAAVLIGVVAIMLLTFDSDITYVTFLYCFAMVGTYFTFESQDSKLLTEIKVANDDARLANKAKSQFLEGISHEIRTSMNTILSYTQAMLDEEHLTQNMINKDAVNIKESSTYLLELINNILDISKIESNKEELEEKEYKLSELLYEISSVVSSKANKDILSFEINVDENIPSVYYGDSNKLYTILIRILENAIEHTKFGSITLDIGGAYNGDTYKISLVVSNTGHEMQEEEFNAEFNSFADVDGKNINLSSTKLGLMVAKSLVELLDGDIEFKNEKGKGTRYIISLDQKVINDDKIGKLFISNSTERVKEVIDCGGKRVLVADDNKLNLKLASRLLEKYKFDIVTIDNGQECIDEAKRSNFDLILVDQMMPDMDGIEVVHKLREVGQNMPIVALTSNTYTGLKETFIKEGFNDYLVKPINQKELYKLLSELFGNKGGKL